MIRGNIGDLRIDARNPVRRERRPLHNGAGPAFVGHVKQYGQRLAERLKTRRGCQAHTTIEVLGIIALVFHPEVPVNAFPDGYGCGSIFTAIHPKRRCHLRQDIVYLVVHGIGAQVLAYIDVFIIHPFGIGLFPPV